MDGDRNNIFRKLKTATEQGGTVTSTPVAALRMQDLSKEDLLDIQPVQISELNIAQIQALLPEQLASMLPSQIAALLPSQARALTTPQLQALMADQIRSLGGTALQALSTEQLRVFTEAQVSALTRAQRDALSEDQRTALNMEPTQKGGTVHQLRPSAAAPSQEVRNERITIYASENEKLEVQEIAEADRVARRAAGARRAKAYSESETAGRLLRFGIEQMRKLGLTRLP